MTPDRVLQIARECGASFGYEGEVPVYAMLTREQLNAFASRIRQEALEEAAEICYPHADDVAAILALKDKP